jgi:uncharacterized SAM-binding protein YcdF (DUF218 family)
VVVAIGGSVVAAYGAFRIWQVSMHDERPTADAIVVLGASQEHGRPLAVLRARLDHAIELYRSNVARYFVVTGGTAEGDVLSEAETARRYAIAAGVPAEAILAETAGRDTYSSLRGAAALLRERSLERAVFVSDRTHMYRVLRMARDLGITAYGSPTTTSPIDRDPGAWLSALTRELLALADYFFVHG